jgi:hypothetical protein
MIVQRPFRLARTLRRFLPVAFAATPLLVARGQANLSGQGFGFPTGQFSARAHGTGGALAEMDPLTPVNPANIAMFGTRVLFFQMEPEFRSVTTAKGTERTTTARYPVVFGALPLASKFTVSLSASTLLDRTSTTSFTTAQAISPTENVSMQTTYHIDGAMDDIRLAGAWRPKNWLLVGVGAHAITGHNLVQIGQSFTDSLQFAAFSQQRTLSFGGSAASAGVQLISSSFVAAASARYGGTLDLQAQDTVLSKARVPNRFGASIAYTGIANSTFSVRTSREDWSVMGPLGTPGLRGVDAWDTSVGADLAGPRFSNRIVFLRGGYRTRTLPFEASGKPVKENSYSGGLGTSFANGRVSTDLAVIRAMRSADLGASERAWTISFGIGVRP